MGIGGKNSEDYIILFFKNGLVIRYGMRVRVRVRV
jgi:hypothetical protein